MDGGKSGPPTQKDVAEDLAFVQQLMEMRDDISPNRQRWESSLDWLRSAETALREHVRERLLVLDDGAELAERLFDPYVLRVQEALRSEGAVLQRWGVLDAVELGLNIRMLLDRARKYERYGN